MSLTDRAVLELAEAWYHSYESGRPDPDDLPEEHDLYLAVRSRSDEPCPYRPNELFGELSVQIMLERKRQQLMGAHLIQISVDTGRLDEYGERIFEDALYLDSDSP